MASKIFNIAICILFVMAVQLPGAAARELSGSPMAAPDATVISVASGGQGALLQWLQITAVPLGVSLLGACTWGVIQSWVPWRSLTGHRESHSSNATDQGDELRPAHELPTIDSSRDGSDLEEGNASS